MVMLDKCFQSVVKRLWGSGIGNIPGIYPLYNLLSKRYGVRDQEITIQGSKMDIRLDGLPDSYIRTFDAYRLSPVYGWEKLTTEAFIASTKIGNTVLDLGANIGYYTLLAARLVGGLGKVYAFEPEPTNFMILARNIKLNNYKNVVAMQRAISNKQGRTKYYVNTKDTGAHSLYDLNLVNGANSKKFIEVDAVVLDDLFPDSVVDVIKMDIEGAEFVALEGMKGIIARSKNITILMELCTNRMARIGYTLGEIYDILCGEYHFNISVIEDFGKVKQIDNNVSKENFMRICKRNKVVMLSLRK